MAPVSHVSHVHNVISSSSQSSKSFQLASGKHLCGFCQRPAVKFKGICAPLNLPSTQTIFSECASERVFLHHSLHFSAAQATPHGMKPLLPVAAAAVGKEKPQGKKWWSSQGCINSYNPAHSAPAHHRRRGSGIFASP